MRPLPLGPRVTQVTIVDLRVHAYACMHYVGVFTEEKRIALFKYILGYVCAGLWCSIQSCFHRYVAVADDSVYAHKDYYGSAHTVAVAVTQSPCLPIRPAEIIFKDTFVCGSTRLRL